MECNPKPQNSSDRSLQDESSPVASAPGISQHIGKVQPPTSSTKETVLIKRQPLVPRDHPLKQQILDVGVKPLVTPKLQSATLSAEPKDGKAAEAPLSVPPVQAPHPPTFCSTQKLDFKAIRERIAKLQPTEEPKPLRSTLHETATAPHVELRSRTHLHKQEAHSVMETNRNLKAAMDVAANDPYDLKEMMARGAEALLYRATSGAFTYCAKSIRNNWCKLLGGNRASGCEKLENVKYTTKLRHIRNEFAIAQKINQDPNADIPVVRIFALRKVTRFGVEIGYDLLMEYLNGHDLADKVLARVLPMEDKIRVLYQAAKALDFLHRKKITHLDIKPSNFMLAADKVKLIDFGVSVHSGIKAAAITGTGGYLSPEQICKETIDERTDIFAFGVTFAVFFGGKPLLQPQEELMTRETKKNAKYLLETSDTPLIQDIAALADMPEIGDLIRNCTIPRRDKRIQTCAMFIAQLKERAQHYQITLD